MRPRARHRHQAVTHRTRAGGLILALLFPALASGAQADIGRLFYTPAQRAQLETARAQNITERAPSRQQAVSDAAPPPVRYDGVVIRSDGQTTRWVNGRPEVGTKRVPGLKPGQIRADGKVYEPYQVLRPAPATPVEPATKESAP